MFIRRHQIADNISSAIYEETANIALENVTKVQIMVKGGNQIQILLRINLEQVKFRINFRAESHISVKTRN
jgi:hypothetical protein